MRLALAIPLAAGLLAAIPLPLAHAQNDRGRPVILLVHGRGMLDRDSAATRKLWVRGLESGSRNLTREPPIEDRDVRTVWYADVLDPRSSDGCDFAPGDLRSRRDRDQDPELRGVVSFAGGVLGALTGLVADSEANSQLRALAADASFLSDPRKRCASEARLAAAIDRARAEGRPVILVGHSLGSVLAYDYLSAQTDTAIVQRFVTLGSPIGAPFLRRLLIGDSSDAPARPVGVKEWINLHNGQDPFGGPILDTPGITDITTSPPADELDPHDMVGYLRTPTTALEIIRGWCGAFTANRPARCTEVPSK